MTAELRDTVRRFMQEVSVKMRQSRNRFTNPPFYHPSTNQVDGFKRRVSHMAVSATEQQAVSLVFYILYVVQSKVQFSSGETSKVCGPTDAEEPFGGSGPAGEAIHQREGRAPSVGDAELHGSVQEHRYL